METGLLIGRFQPFHNGHLAAVQYALKKVDLLYIGIGSAQRSHELNNPFTAAERVKMITSALDEIEVDRKRYLPIPIQDATAHALWLGYVNLVIPKYDVVFSNDPLTTRLFNESRIKVISVKLKNRPIYSATNVRKRMIKGQNWKDLVPLSIAKIIYEIDGIERLKKLKIKI
jgi:nicotinamide-nucleotide adenylyltransferase